LNIFNNFSQIIDRKYVTVFWSIVLLAFLLRLSISFFTGLSWYSVDSYTYLRMADAIVNNEPFSRFPNGFPLLLAGLKIFIPDAWIPASIIWVNILASTAVVGLAMSISKKISQNTILACLAGVLLALYPNQLNYVRQILTEAPTTFFLVFQVYLFIQRKYAASAACLVIAVLFRSSLLPLIPFMLACVYLKEYKGNPNMPTLRYAAGITIITIIYIGLVLLGIIKPSGNIKQNLLISIQSYGGNIDYSIKDYTSEQIGAPLKTYFIFAYENTGEYLKQRLLSLNELWGWPSTGEPPRSMLKKLLIALRIPIFIGSIAAFSMCIKDLKIWLLFVPIFTITVIHTLFFSTTRFSFVVEPFAIILTSIYLLSLYNNWTNKN